MNNENFRINTDYPIDKVILLREITVTPTSYGEFDYTFTHGLGAIPFCKAVATDDDWNTTYQSGVQRMAESGQYAQRVFNCYSNATSVRVYGWLQDTSIGETIKPATIRIWGVFNESATQNVDVPPTREASNNNFIVNSDYNYPALFMEGTTASIAAGNSVTIYHNLGFVPIADIWQLVNGWWTEVSNMGSFDDSSKPAVIDSTTLKLGALYSATQYYYRIYS